MPSAPRDAWNRTRGVLGHSSCSLLLRRAPSGPPRSHLRYGGTRSFPRPAKPSPARPIGTSVLSAPSLGQGRPGESEEADVVRADFGRDYRERAGQLVVRLLEPTSVILAQAAAAGSGAPTIDVCIDHHGVDLSVRSPLAMAGKGAARCSSRSCARSGTTSNGRPRAGRPQCRVVDVRDQRKETFGARRPRRRAVGRPRSRPGRSASLRDASSSGARPPL